MITRQLSNITSMITGSSLVGEDKLIQGVSIDSRNILAGNLFIPIVGPNHNGHRFVQTAFEKGAVATLWQKGEPNPPSSHPVIYVEDTLKALQILAHSYRLQLKATFIGITGSNGKTSTKDILHSILATKFKTQKTQGNFNNEIGVPLTLLELDEDVEMAVIEMGMGKRGDISFLSGLVRPNISIITNIGHAHLVNFQTLENIAREKMDIISGMNADGLLIFNGDLDLLVSESIRYPFQKKTFGMKDTNTIHLTSCIQEDELQFTISDSQQLFFLPLLGEHQAVNALSAIMVARHFHLSDREISTGLHHTSLSGQRYELKVYKNITIINDTYKSNPESIGMALRTLYAQKGERKLFVMGDMFDMGEKDRFLHEQIGHELDPRKLDCIYGYGDSTSYTIRIAQTRFSPGRAVYFSEEQKLIEAIINYAKEPCTILFKASRGLQFERLIDSMEKREIR